MLGMTEPYVRLPYFYSDQYDFGMEYTGHAPAWDRVVFRGDPAGREFCAFWLSGGRMVEGMSANVGQVHDAIVALIGPRGTVAVECLEDSSVPLDDLEAIVVPDHRTTE
jgi:3-phenylpropionate/trans-cinnamate dioxygenase ferredoxin reductase component